MKYSLPTTTLLALFAMSLMVMTVSSSGLRGRALQSISVEGSNLSAPSIKISGVSTLLQILNSATDFTNSNFDVITIDSFSESVSDQGVSIDGKVTIANDHGVNVSGLVNGAWDPVNNNIVFNVTKYEVDNEDSDKGDSDASDDNGDNSTTTSDGYTIVPIEVAQNDTNISAAFNWGVQALIEKGEKQNKIPISDYAVTEWISAAYKQKSNGIYYKFVAKLLGANYVHVDTKITTFLYTNQTYSLAGYHFHAYNITKGSLPNNFTDVDNNSTNTTVVPPVAVPEDYTWIPAEDLANNTIAQNALSWGVDALVAKAISQYKLPAADPEYNVTNLILAAYKKTGYGSAYIFWTNSTNDLKYKLDANITVKYWSSKQTYTLAGYSFHSYGYPASAIVIPPPVNGTNSTSNSTNNATDNSTALSNVTVPDNSTIVDNSTVIDPNNSTQPVDNSTVIDPNNSTSPSNVTVPDNSTVVDNNSTTNSTQPALNTTAPVVPQTTSDGYTIYTPDQLANDSQAEAALQYGANALIAKGISQNKIPAANPNYTINSIALAAYKKVVIGTYYKFVINMTNVDSVHVDANLTIFYRYSTKALSLNGYWFHSYNYSSKALSNNHGNNDDHNNKNNNGNGHHAVPVHAANNANTSVPVANSTVIDPNSGNTNSTVVANGSAANNATSSYQPTAPVDNSSNSTVIDPSAPVSGDNSTVVDNGNTNATVVNANTTAGSR